MPANDTYWRSLKKMHVVFAVSAVGLFVATLAMMWSDHSDEWREYQTTFDRIEDLRIQSQIAAETTDVYTARVADLESRLADANQDYVANKESIEEEIQDLEYRLNLAERELRAKRAFRDKARADYDLAIRDEREKAAEELKEDFNAQQQKVDEIELQVQQRTEELNRAKQKRQALRDQITAIENELAAAQKDVDRLQKSKKQIAPDSFLASAKREVMQWPIIDGFNSPHQIKQIWLPDLKITLGMAQTARFDRCQTCHLGIERVEAGNLPTFPHGKGEDFVPTDDPTEEQLKNWVDNNRYPHPYATHPDPDLYLTSTSPHPMMEFGCTSCHDGQGSATSFNNVQHTPNNPFEKDHWEEKYHYHYNHFWEYPMQPDRFKESTCVKCHHDVVELANSPQFGNSAPKVVKGFHTIQQYGCFGCHEFHGQDGAESIGPDLRVEPNYFAVALEMASAAKIKLASIEKSGEESNAADELKAIVELAEDVASAPEDTESKRRDLQQWILADKTLEDPLFDARIHGLADGLKTVENPGRYRKVGPTLRYLDKKTYDGWVEFWTNKPSNFRPSTRMPQFFHLSNQDDPQAQAYQPVQIAAIGHYLINESQPLDLLSPQKGYQPDPERGKKLFSERGCLACHSYKDFPEIQSDFGPNLDKVYAKLKPGQAGFQWLYSWIREPHRYNKRTKMPNLFLEPYVPKGQDQTNKENEVDPAADIAAYLLQEREKNAPKYEPFNDYRYDVLMTSVGETPDAVAQVVADTTGLNADEVGRLMEAVPQSVRGMMPKDEADQLIARLEKAGAKATGISNLDRLVSLYLSQALTINQMADLGKTRLYPFKPEQIKGDEIELVYEGEGQPSDEEWQAMKLNYVGRRTIAQYGCYGCHDIPGFEAAKPIGVALQDWGRKDTSRLAFEHIGEFLQHHKTYDVVLSEVGENRENVQKILAAKGQGNALEGGLPLVIETNISGAEAERLIERLNDAGAVATPSGQPTLTAQVDQGMKRANADEFKSPEAAEDALTLAYYYDSILHHGRPGFLWQKLRMPRSYDYKKIETKRYDERLRMPKFPFDDEQIEAVATFVLGLIAEPPAEKYVFNPQGRSQARFAGEALLHKYNCTSCHMVDLPEVQYSVARQLTKEDAIEWFVENRESLISGDLGYKTPPAESEKAQSFSQPYRQLHQEAQKQAKVGLNELAELADEASQDEPDETDKDAAYRSYLDHWFIEHPGVLAAKYSDAISAIIPGQSMTREQIVNWFVEQRSELLQGDLETYPADIELINELCKYFKLNLDVAGIAKLANLDSGSVGRKLSNKQIEAGFRLNLTKWFDNHPEILLTEKPDQSKGLYPEGVKALLKLKPPYDAATSLTSKTGDAVLRFHGMGRETEGEYSQVLWDTLDLGGRIILPTNKMPFTKEQIVSMNNGRGGPFAQWLTYHLAGGPNAPLDKVARGRQSSPPPLVLEGLKVQTSWLFNFLKNPERIRNETVLRMPRFNMSDAEARALANYFAAVDDTAFPYQDIPERDPQYSEKMNAMYKADYPEDAQKESEYLARSWELLGKFPVCRKCHEIAGDKLAVTDPTQLIHGPNLDTRLDRRFRPVYLDAWLHTPAWVLPYTSMIGPTGDPLKGYFDAEAPVQVRALRDAMLNYNKLYQSEGKIEPPPPQAATEAPAAKSGTE